MNATDAMGDILFFALGVCLFLFGNHFGILSDCYGQSVAAGEE